MASLTATRLPKAAAPFPRTNSKIHQHPQFIYSKQSMSLQQRRVFRRKTTIRLASSNSSATTSSSPGGPGLYSAQKFDLTVSNVDLVLEDVRPYLISDGGNVDVVSIEDGVISLKLQGACGSCPSSTTTMKMGIERVLKEKFGDAVKDICQVYDEETKETTCQAVNNHLDILRPAIKNFGGSVEVLSVEGGDCLVNYVGPESIGSGIKAAIKEKFPDIMNVLFSS
ncbi:nifU-like protein 1, chloroplastic [Quillaja saponaria]|uniref:NifU-like protein 1, chloroplastic n=1 Tax=Quillaja saponaria TaxID=32244 RepID=A0AAD7Q1H3_QUISA|nr:nifU-like protein 1, chloroplastic [Quillaja saponaria]